MLGIHNVAVKRGALSRDEIWSELHAYLGDELLAQLLRVPNNSLAGYARDSASHAIEARAAHLATVAQNLSGTYNSWGAQRWFARSRAQLGGRSPLQVLVDAGEWMPDGKAAADVATLARALLGMPAT